MPRASSIKRADHKSNEHEKSGKMIKDVLTDIGDSGRRGREASSVDRPDPVRSTLAR